MPSTSPLRPSQTLTLDRRDIPSHGYRAVHIIAVISGKPVEVQVRTSLQHLWAEVSEKSSDVLDPTIKYGGGTDSWRSILTGLSELVASYEEMEKKSVQFAAEWEVYVAAGEIIKKLNAEILEHHPTDHEAQQEVREMLENEPSRLERAEQEDQEMRKEMVRQWKVIADVLNLAISRLDTLKGQK